jgi:hypothetical protein
MSYPAPGEKETGMGRTDKVFSSGVSYIKVENESDR